MNVKQIAISRCGFMDAGANESAGAGVRACVRAGVRACGRAHASDCFVLLYANNSTKEFTRINTRDA